MENTTAVDPNATEAPTTPMALTRGQFEGLPLTPSVRVILLVAGWAACLCGIFGNILVITTVLCQKTLRSRNINLYIVNLAAADLVVMGYVVPHWLLDLSLGHQPVLDQSHCNANAFVAVMAAGASIYSLVLISCDRYVRVSHLNVYVKFASRRRMVASCVGVWTISAGAGLVPMFRLYNTAFIYNPHVRMCTFDSMDPNNGFSVLACVNLIVPTVLISFFSVSMLWSWKSSRNRIRQWIQKQDGWRVPSHADPQPSRLSTSEMSLIRSLLLVFVLLFVFYLPMVVALSTSGRMRVSTDWYNFIVLFYFLNHSVNWIVYGALNNTFKKGYKRLLAGSCFSVSFQTDTN